MKERKPTVQELKEAHGPLEEMEFEGSVEVYDPETDGHFNADIETTLLHKGEENVPAEFNERIEAYWEALLADHLDEEFLEAKTVVIIVDADGSSTIYAYLADGEHVFESPYFMPNEWSL